MKIDLNIIDRERFLVDENIILARNESIYFVTPDTKAEGLVWTQKNKIFRSSVWGLNGDLVSASFPKFMNWGEHAEEFPVPNSLDGCSIYEKMDGVLLIVSQYKGHRIVRTRGQLDAEQLPGGDEVRNFKNTVIQRIAEYYYDHKSWPISFLFEWLSPKNRIVVNYDDKPKFVFVGAINHKDYSLMSQQHLDDLAGGLGLERPRKYGAYTADSLILDVAKWDNREGVVVFSKDGQSMHKIKSNWYNAMHRLKTEMPTIESVIDVWLEWGQPKFDDFMARIKSQFDFELANQVLGEVSRICDAWKEVQKILEGFSRFIREKMKAIPAWGSAEEVVYSSFGKTNRAEYILKIYKGKLLEKDDLKKLIFQCLKR